MKNFAQDLFPQLRFYYSYWEKREYVESRLIEMAKAGTLYLTDVCNQPDARAVQLAGEVICGTQIEDKRYVEASIALEIEEYRCALRPLNDTQIVEYESGWKQVGQLRNQLPILRKVNRTWQINKDGYVKIPLKDTWIALHRYGKDVRVAKSSNLRAVLWRYEEVRPEEIRQLEEAKRLEETTTKKDKKAA